MSFAPLPAPVQPLSHPFPASVAVDVLRLDLLHPVVSGNKWFKLKHYVEDAKAQGKKNLLTFGGAYSNHLVATAAAAEMHGLASIGIVRGEEPAVWSHTLRDAKRYGMDLRFVSRDDYRRKSDPQNVCSEQEDTCIISEGGAGEKGVQGAADILSAHNTKHYTHIITAVGTGTTLAGLATAAEPHQSIIGIVVLKNAFSLQQEIEAMLPGQKHRSFSLLFHYHFGGYARHTPELLRFMNDCFATSSIATDFVYTGKAFFATVDLLKAGHFPSGSRVLLVHTGGLQGNRSLKKGALIFP